MFKTITTLMMAGMIVAGTGAAYAETRSFTISVVIPQMIFSAPDMNMASPQDISQQRDLPKNVQQDILVRNKKEVVVTSAVVL